MAEKQRKPKVRVSEGARTERYRIQQRAGNLNNLIMGATIVGVFYCLYLIAGEVAGKNTGFVVEGLDFLSDYLPWGVGVAGAGYGYSQRRLRQYHVKQKSRTVQNLERIIDPGRTSAGLGEDGRTHERHR